jgi:hypothetical protein
LSAQRPQHRGLVDKYNIQWKVIAEAGGPVEILGMCQSACTLVMAHVPKDRLCFGQDGYLNFHQARSSLDGSLAPETTKWMIRHYPDDIRNWIDRQGGVEMLPTHTYWTLRASELWKMGYSKCVDLSTPTPEPGR